MAANSAPTTPTPRPLIDVDLDAGLVQRAQHAGVIGPARAVAAQENGGSQVW